MRRIASSIFVLVVCFSLSNGQTPTTPGQAENDDWQKVSVCGFSFAIPGDFKRSNIMGLDSCVAGFASDTMNLSIDYGQYTSRTIKRDRDFDFKEQTMTIDGKSAQVVTFNDDTTFSAGKKPYYRYFARLWVMVGKGFDAHRELSLSMHISCVRESDLEVALKVFRSIRFERAVG